MRLPSVPGPGDLRALVDQALAVAPRAVNLLGGAEDLLARAGGLIGDVEALLGRVEQTRQRADVIVDGVDATRARADEIVDGIAEVRRRADDVVDQAQVIADKGDRAMGGLDDVRHRADVLLTRVEAPVGRLLDLVERLEPSLLQLEPVLQRLAETTSPAEVDAAVGMVDHLPRLEEALKDEVMPMLMAFSSVAPDMHQLLEIVQELSELVGNLPGMGRIKKRVEQQEDEADEAEALSVDR